MLAVRSRFRPIRPVKRSVPILHVRVDSALSAPGTWSTFRRKHIFPWAVARARCATIPRRWSDPAELARNSRSIAWFPIALRKPKAGLSWRKAARTSEEIVRLVAVGLASLRFWGNCEHSNFLSLNRTPVPIGAYGPRKGTRTPIPDVIAGYDFPFMQNLLRRPRRGLRRQDQAGKPSHGRRIWTGSTIATASHYTSVIFFVSRYSTSIWVSPAGLADGPDGILPLAAAFT